MVSTPPTDAPVKPAREARLLSTVANAKRPQLPSKQLDNEQLNDKLEKYQSIFYSNHLAFMLPYLLASIAILLFLLGYVYGCINWLYCLQLLIKWPQERITVIPIGWILILFAHSIALYSGLGYEPYWSLVFALGLLLDLPGALFFLWLVVFSIFSAVKYIWKGRA